MEDLDDIADILEANGVRLILMSYPDPFYREELSRFARRRGVLFLDHVPAFRKAVATRPREAFFRRDSHCTKAGYGIMARGLFELLDREGLAAPRGSS